MHLSRNPLAVATIHHSALIDLLNLSLFLYSLEKKWLFSLNLGAHFVVRPRVHASLSRYQSAKCKLFSTTIYEVKMHITQKFKYFGVVFRVTKIGTNTLMHRLVKKTEFCVCLIAMWSQNGNFPTPQSCQFLNLSSFRFSTAVMNLA